MAGSYDGIVAHLIAQWFQTIFHDRGACPDRMQSENSRAGSSLGYGSHHALKTSLSKRLERNIPML